jgi:hypothetical protein
MRDRKREEREKIRQTKERQNVSERKERKQERELIFSPVPVSARLLTNGGLQFGQQDPDDVEEQDEVDLATDKRDYTEMKAYSWITGPGRC